MWSGAAFYFVYFLAAGAYMPFIYVYFVQLGMSGIQVGVLSSFAPAMSILVAPLVASFADRSGRRILVARVCLFCTSALLICLRIAESFPVAAALMLILAFFSTGVMPIVEGIIAHQCRQKGQNFGAMRLWGSLGWAIAALGFAALWERTGYPEMFVACGALSFVLVPLLSKLRDISGSGEKWGNPFVLLRDKALLLVLLATFFAALSSGLSMTFSGVYAQWLRGGNMIVGAISAAGALAELPLMFFSWRIADRVGEAKALVIAYLTMGGACAGFAASPSAALLPLLAAMRGFGYGLWIPVTVRVVARRTPVDLAATGQALLAGCIMGLGPLVAGPVGGALYDRLSPRAVFGLAALGVLAAVPLITWGTRLLVARGGHLPNE